MSKAFSQRRVKDPTEMMDFLLKVGWQKETVLKSQKTMALLRLKIALNENVQQVINNIKFDSKSCFTES